MWRFAVALVACVPPTLQLVWRGEPARRPPDADGSAGRAADYGPDPEAGARNALAWMLPSPQAPLPPGRPPGEDALPLRAAYQYGELLRVADRFVTALDNPTLNDPAFKDYKRLQDALSSRVTEVGDLRLLRASYSKERIEEVVRDCVRDWVKAWAKPGESDAEAIRKYRDEAATADEQLTAFAKNYPARAAEADSLNGPWRRLRDLLEQAADRALEPPDRIQLLDRLCRLGKPPDEQELGPIRSAVSRLAAPDWLPTKLPLDPMVNLMDMVNDRPTNVRSVSYKDVTIVWKSGAGRPATSLSRDDPKGITEFDLSDPSRNLMDDVDSFRFTEGALPDSRHRIQPTPTNRLIHKYNEDRARLEGKGGWSDEAFGNVQADLKGLVNESDAVLTYKAEATGETKTVKASTLWTNVDRLRAVVRGSVLFPAVPGRPGD